MKPGYQLRIWQEDGWWLARVTAASNTADPAPINAVTQARSLSKIESMGRDLIATILDADESEFEVEPDYSLPHRLAEPVSQAREARACLNAAHNLWHEQSIAAVRLLAGEGYSLRDAAALLGLSHQRVDQILADESLLPSGQVLIFADRLPLTQTDTQSSSMDGHDVEAMLVLRTTRDEGWRQPTGNRSDLEAKFRERLAALVSRAAERVSLLAAGLD